MVMMVQTCHIETLQKGPALCVLSVFKTKQIRHFFVFYKDNEFPNHFLIKGIFFFFSGHYIPQLAQVMVEFNQKQKLFNLKGIAVSLTKYYLTLNFFYGQE